MDFSLATPHDMEFTDPSATPALLLASAVGWHVVDLLLQPTLTLLLPKAYGSMPVGGGKQRELRSYAMGFAHAILVAPTALYCFLYDPILSQDMDLGRSFLSTCLLALSGGFFIWDALLCVRRFSMFGMGFLLHGVVCAMFYFYLCYTGNFHFYGVFGLLFELSTPFLEVRHFLKSMGQAGSVAFHITNLLFASTFFLARILGGIYAQSIFWTRVWEMPQSMPHRMVLFTTSIPLCCLNVVWFYGIMKSGLKQRKPKQSSKQLQ